MRSAREMVMVRRGGALVPYGNGELEEFERQMTTNKPVMVSIRRARNPLHSAKLWSIAARVADFCDDFHDAEDAVDYVKERIPNMHTKTARVRPDGTVEITIRLKSIAFDAMDQTAFERFYDRALWLWARKIGTDPETLGMQAA